MNKISWLLIAIIIVLLSRCDFPEAPGFKEEISIFAILRPGVKQQKFSIYNTYEFIADSVSAEDLFMKDAKVIVSSYGQEIEFSYFFDENCLKSIYRFLRQINRKAR